MKRQNHKSTFRSDRASSQTELIETDMGSQTDCKSVKSCFKDFLSTSTVKGVAKATKSDRYAIRILWMVAVIFGFSFATFQLYFLFRGYLSFESVTKITQCNDCKPPFPDVTICNLNPLLFLQEWGDNLQMTYSEFYANLEENIANTNWTAFMENNHVTLEETIFVLNELRALETYLQNAVGNLSPEEAEILFYSYLGSNFLVHGCTWYDWNYMVYMKEDCRTQSIFATFNTDYFVCYTIHLNDSNLQHDGFDTDVSGLQALLYLHDFPLTNVEYTATHIIRSQAIGARILIHPPDTYPFMKDAFDIPPGHEVIINVEAEKYERAPHPYSSCSDRKYIEDISGYTRQERSQMIRYRYTDVSAMYRCWQEQCVKTCGCYNQYLPTTAGLVYEHPDVTLCTELQLDENGITNFTDTLQDALCYYSLYVNISNEQGDKQDKCFYDLPCNEYKYKTQVIQTPWPHQSHHLSLYKHVINATDPSTRKFGDRFNIYENISETMAVNASEGFRMLMDTDLIFRNFIQLKVQFVGKGERISKDVPAMTDEILFGSLGGILNLWIGITFVTLIEIAELLIQIVSNLCVKNNMKAVFKFPAFRKRKVSDVWDHTVPPIVPKRSAPTKTNPF